MALVASGGGSLNVTGSLDVSYGQVACEYDITGAYSGGEGIQQPYPPICPDTVLRGEEVYDVCDSMVWNGMEFRYDTVVDYPQTTLRGCDSIATLRLTVRHSSYAEEEVQASFHYTLQGQTFTESGEYRLPSTMSNSVGCDSMVLLRLALLKGAPIPVICQYNNQIIMVDHFPNGEDGNYVDYQSYRWYQNGKLLNFATSDHYFRTNGRAGYQPLEGCYYVEVYTGANNFWVRSNEICITPSKTATTSLLPSLNIYPNPSRGENVLVVMERVPEGSQLRLYTLEGRLLWHVPAVEGTLPIAAGSLPTGIYTLMLAMPQTTMVQKLIIR
ncbi:MAG: T9SS type A sorting domain-containing protein [Bacteroidales bacterium]|nr:T9SS type A sorting domain-containing protein [Bacteroidales bacterium]